MPLCERHGCTLVVNDDWQLALELGIGAVHIGGDDGDVQAVRAAVGPEVIVGVSCYADLARARELAPYADYLAFGSVFASSTKPKATAAALEILSAGQDRWGCRWWRSGGSTQVECAERCSRRGGCGCGDQRGVRGGVGG